MNADDRKVTITHISEESALDSNNMPDLFIRVDFKVGSHGPFTERIRKKEYDPAALKAKLDAFANSLAQLTGY